MNDHWGHCKNCKWWDVESTEAAAREPIGYCMEEDLQPFHLRVTSSSGCNCFVSLNEVEREKAAS